MNHLTKRDDDARVKRLAELMRRLTPWFTRWHETFPTHEVTERQIGAYCETLVDRLAPEHVDRACDWAGAHCENFPKPFHILKGLSATVGEDSVQHNRPAYLDDPPNSENKEFIDAMARLAKQPRDLGPHFTRVEPTPPRTEFKFPQRTKSLDQQKEELRRRGYLK